MDTTPTNAHEYSVSELALSLKRTVEETYGRVRVRGELGRVVIAKSGHMYVDVKDDKAVIASIMWKGNVSRLSVRPEEGMEVVVEGKLSTYPGRSQYQLIIDRLEPAGVGALMALLEKRKKQFAAEGLFDEDHKRELPYLPQTIGVVTSPTGAVIRDILHRISDRFPVRVLVWPVLVQGERAAEQITDAINGFNALTENRPDVLIVARGGGSIEDLWSFNEENVVRAAASSDIPLISAVGHETDWTLIDYVSDARAPTPTGAAEIAVPVRSELIDTVDDYALRLRRGLSRTVEHKALGLSGAKLPRLDTVLSAPRQRFDMAAGRLLPALDINRKAHESRVRELAAKLPRLDSILSRPQQRLSLVGARLAPALNIARRSSASRLREVAARLRPEGLLQNIVRRQERVSGLSREAGALMQRRLERGQDQVTRAGKLLDAYSYEGVLARGYALVTDEAGVLVREGAGLHSGQDVNLQFADTKRKAVIDGSPKSHTAPKPAKKRSVRTEETQNPPQKQLGLF